MSNKSYQLPPEMQAARRSAINLIRTLIEFHGITEDLILSAPEPPVPISRRAPKYRHPRHPELTWDGIGPQPQWLRVALTNEGHTVEELRCHAEAGMQSVPPLPQTGLRP